MAKESYNFSFRVEKGSEIDRWLSAQNTKAGSVKALIFAACKKYGEQDLLSSALTSDKFEDAPTSKMGRPRKNQEEETKKQSVAKENKAEIYEVVGDEEEKTQLHKPPRKKKKQGNSSNWRSGMDLF